MPSREIIDRRPTMVVCPVCGYDPDPTEVAATPEELWRKRIRDIFTVNSMQPWWLTQTEYVCRWLKECGVDPQHILDFGCGDGRWIYGVGLVFPRAAYVGIDRLVDHYLLNKERLPEIEWAFGDFCNYVPRFKTDMILLMGTLNPAMPELDRNMLFGAIKKLKPKNVVSLFDYKSTGRPAQEDIEDIYATIDTMKVPREYQGIKQDIEVSLHELK